MAAVGFVRRLASSQICNERMYERTYIRTYICIYRYKERERERERVGDACPIVCESSRNVVEPKLPETRQTEFHELR